MRQGGERSTEPRCASPRSPLGVLACTPPCALWLTRDVCRARIGFGSFSVNPWQSFFRHRQLDVATAGRCTEAGLSFSQSLRCNRTTNFTVLSSPVSG